MKHCYYFFEQTSFLFYLWRIQVIPAYISLDKALTTIIHFWLLFLSYVFQLLFHHDNSDYHSTHGLKIEKKYLSKIRTLISFISRGLSHRDSCSGWMSYESLTVGIRSNLIMLTYSLFQTNFHVPPYLMFLFCLYKLLVFVFLRSWIFMRTSIVSHN